MPIPDHDFFVAFEKRRTQALVERDEPGIRAMHTPDYELITVPGRVMCLNRYLALMATDVFYAAWEHGPIKVKATEGMAALRYQAKIVFPSGRVVRCWHLDLYEPHENQWRAFWSQATELHPDDVPAI